MSRFVLIHPAGDEFPIEGSVTFGRGAGANYTLQDVRVSRRHATLYLAGDELMVRDEGSANGTFVNDQRIQAPTVLNDGDQLRLGETTLTVRAPAPAAHAAPAPAAPAPKHSPPSTRLDRSRRWLPLAIGGCALLALCSLAAVGAAALLPGLDLSERVTSMIGGSEYTLEQALAEETVDDRPEVIAYLGLPDAFSISQVVVEGVPIRMESWRYFGFGLRVDFVDGEAVWTMDIDPVPEYTILPAWYDPLEFEMGMTIDEAAAVAAAASPAGVRPQAIDLSEGGPDLVGHSVLAGDQIMIGLGPDGVVYVETMALFPAEVGG